MLLLTSENTFIKKIFCDLFKQRKILTMNEVNDAYFFLVFLKFENQFLKCQIANKNNIQWQLPICFNKIFLDINNILSNEYILIDSLKYFPFKQTIQNGEIIYSLSQIHNIILSNLLLFKNSGLKKYDLIKIIWPNDKSLLVNKLDTHLTNLKNHLLKEIGFNLKFSSKSGILKLIID